MSTPPDHITNPPKPYLTGGAETQHRIILPSVTGLETTPGTGGQRSDASGKGRLDLFPPPWATLRLAQHAEEACAKGGYPERNWEKGIHLSRYYSSSLRHTLQWWGGAKDEPHLTAAAWNVVAALETQHRISLGLLPTELDDRPKPSMVALTAVTHPDATHTRQCYTCCSTPERSWLPNEWKYCPRCGKAL